MNPSRNPWPAVVAVVVVAVLASILRVVIASDELLWLDELHTSWVVGDSLAKVAGRAADGNQAPLYFWLTWIPVSTFGASELSVRLVSLLSGIGLLLVSSWLAWRWTRSAIASFVVAALVGLDVHFVYYATEARPYSLVQFLGALQVYFFWRFLCQSFQCLETENGEGNSEEYADSEPSTLIENGYLPDWGLAITSALLLCAHYTSAWLFVVEILFLPIVWFGFTRSPKPSDSCESARSRPIERKRFAFRSLATGVVVALAGVPMLMQMVAVFRRRGNWTGVSSIEKVAMEQVIPFATWVLFPLILLVIGALLKTGKPKGRFNQYSNVFVLVFVLLWAIVPTLCVLVMDYQNVAPMALTRYTLVGAAAFPIFAGLVIGCCRSTIGQLMIAGLVLAVSVLQNPIPQYFADHRELPKLRVEDWLSIAQEISAREQKRGHPVFLLANLIEDVDALKNDDRQFKNYLLFPIQGLYSIDLAGRELIACPTMPTTHFLDRHIEFSKVQEGAWVVVRAEPSLVQEVADEFRARSDRLFGTANSPIISVMDSDGISGPDLQNPVYLLSIDW